ncbi:MAG TPA: type II toxin-antitoxin system VapC family toxin [Terracidiphilus sp.]|jgi:PIN domain nuclease of toxin-antitoxin system|nr:type II toxin-antitoxin system VapC family toxin [Terracidiphilus sp.]
MSEAVLDASAILALLQEEPGGEKLTDSLLADSLASVVNLAEVQSKLVLKGLNQDEAWDHATSVAASAETFTEEQAQIAGGLIAKTQAYGLSLGDRACLALAIARKAEVYTTERIWKKLKLDIRIHVIR